MAESRRTTHLAPASPQTIAAAAACLRGGGLVATPTETVYGLAADATSDAAVAAIFAAKGRPAFNPLIAHVLDIEAARRHAIFGRDAERLAQAFWPGPLTLVLPSASACRVSLLARAGLDSLAIRAPAHPVARGLIEEAGVPLAAPSANRSGRISPTTAAHALADLDGRIDWILDGGPSRHGLESTIVACLDAPTLLRPGAIPGEAIEAVLGRPLGSPAASGKRSYAPGQLESHYAPRARVRLDAARAEPDEAALDFAGALKGGPALARLDLSPSGDLVEAASNLFAHLRALDGSGARTIAAAPVPHGGLGAAINDRLCRAAAARGG
ncbi:MAG TPA: L-threonylcarbamoyladenylate synthase [Roseiarcus sp.]|jgi:L-threonylcarbamoyladenylate synthase|nr:L-threonylcarbamoyladenylate synthase [Roseiarcus sp.]